MENIGWEWVEQLNLLDRARYVASYYEVHADELGEEKEELLFWIQIILV